MDVVLLPGLDGTGTLFSPFTRKSPEWANPVVISYDREQAQDYEQLANIVLKSIDQDSPYILVGESFSGPVAVLVAAKAPSNLIGVILCASFVVNPRPLMSLLFFPAIFRTMFSMGLPEWIIKFSLIGWEGSPELVKAVSSIIRSVSPEVLIARMRMVIEADVTIQLASCTIPLMCISSTNDRLVTRRSISTLRSIKPELSSVQLNGPHCILQSKPAEAWQVISNFVDKITTNMGLKSTSLLLGD